MVYTPDLIKLGCGGLIHPGDNFNLNPGRCFVALAVQKVLLQLCAYGYNYLGRSQPYGRTYESTRHYMDCEYLGAKVLQVL